MSFRHPQRRHTVSACPAGTSPGIDVEAVPAGSASGSFDG
jgi:hypothetical protein